MATRNTNREHQQAAIVLPTKRGISTRSRNVQENFDPINSKQISQKRKADDLSPLKNKTSKIKRSALGNLTNASNAVTSVQDDNLNKKTGLTNNSNRSKQHEQEQQPQKTNGLISSNVTITSMMLDQKHGILMPQSNMIPRSTKILTRAAVKSNALAAIQENLASVANRNTKKIGGRPAIHSETIVKPKDGNEITAAKPTTRRISNEFHSDDSLYMSALEDISEVEGPKCDSTRIVVEIPKVQEQSKSLNQNETTTRIKSPDLSTHVVPDNVVDFDKENWDDPFQVSHYANDIFIYLREREEHFVISDYMAQQVTLTKWMRSLLVDWMVEVQESFELNHETLYLAVKIVDLYLSKETISKDSLQLLGAAALFISSKYEENNPPLIEDFLYICDGAYSDKQLTRMEKIVFRTIKFCLGIPLSYRFLRRYARVAKIPMSQLTLARFILELSLMDYGTIQFRDSKTAAAALFIALRMNDLPGWNDTLAYYSGYKLEDFSDIVIVLNAGLSRKPKETINTIRKKYSHSVFMAVAKVPLKMTTELFSNCPNVLALPAPKTTTVATTKQQRL